MNIYEYDRYESLFSQATLAKTIAVGSLNDPTYRRPISVTVDILHDDKIILLCRYKSMQFNLRVDPQDRSADEIDEVELTNSIRSAIQDYYKDILDTLVYLDNKGD